jgi:hypothetical protein
MLPNPTHNRQPIHPCIQNEFQFKGIYTRIDDIIPDVRFPKVCNEFHVVLDIIFWIGLFVLKEDERVVHDAIKKKGESFDATSEEEVAQNVQSLQAIYKFTLV